VGNHIQARGYPFSVVTFQLENYFQPKQNSEEPQNRTKVYLIRALT